MTCMIISSAHNPQPQSSSTCHLLALLFSFLRLTMFPPILRRDLLCKLAHWLSGDPFFFGKLLLMDPSSIKQLISSLGIIKEWVPSTRCWARPKDPRLRCRGRCPEPWPRCHGDRRLGHHRRWRGGRRCRRVAGRSLGRRLRRWRLLLFGLEGDGRQGRIAGQHGTGLLQDLPQDGKNDETCGSGAKAPFESIWTKQVSCSGRWMKKNSPRVGIDEYMSSSTVDVAFGCFWWGERSSCSTYVSCLLMPSNVVAPSSSCRCLLSQLFCPCMCPTCPNLFALLGGLHGQLSPMFFRRWGFLSQHWNEGMEAKDCAPIPTAYFSTQGISPPEGTSCSLMPKASIRLIPASTRQVAAGCARCAFLQRCEEVPPTSPTTCQVCSIH